MMGHHARSESLFYYFRLEDQVPENHLLRLIDEHIDFSFVREHLKDSYSDTGRPSIDPELLLRIVLIGYLYGISSERKLVEELRMHPAWRWFTGLGFDQKIPHHSTFSKNRHGRFQESKLFEQMFERIVAQCLEVGLVHGDKLSVDGTFVEANASKESRIPREQPAEAAQLNRTVREWLAELEAQNPVEEDEALSLASAIHAISETHLGGEDILFADTRAALEVESANLRVTADMCGHLAAWLNGEPIAVDGFTSGHPMVDAKVNEIVHISRAEALASCSDLRKFKEALQEAFPELVEGDRR